MYLIFDTETTGKANFNAPASDESQPRLVQLGALLLSEKFETMAELNVIIKPKGYTIPEEVAKIHGITQQIAERYGIPEPLALDMFSDLVSKADTLVAHNITFDALVMGRAYTICDECVITLPPKKRCTMNEMTNLCKLPGYRGEFKWPNLQEAHKHCFGVGFEGAHDAMADVRACAKVFRWLVEGGKPQPTKAPMDDEIDEPIVGYTDTTPMPFGKHRGIPLSDVPASYLHWLWGQRPMSDHKLEAYIKANLSALKTEHPDGIW